MTTNIQIDASRITDWDTFRDTFSEAFGFPAYYGRNMNAWIDCMTCLDDATADTSEVHVGLGDVLVLNVLAVTDFRLHKREIYDALVECSSFVNWRRIEKGHQAVLALSFHV